LRQCHFTGSPNRPVYPISEISGHCQYADQRWDLPRSGSAPRRQGRRSISPEQTAFELFCSEPEVAAPRRGIVSSPGQELLGVITSHGPSRESYRSSRKSRGSAEAFSAAAADAAVSAQRMRAALSAPAGAPALLQPVLPGGSAEVVAVEGAATIPWDSGGSTETEGSKPALP
jgi:hypothetical protein